MTSTQSRRGHKVGWESNAKEPRLTWAQSSKTYERDRKEWDAMPNKGWGSSASQKRATNQDRDRSRSPRRQGTGVAEYHARSPYHGDGDKNQGRHDRADRDRSRSRSNSRGRDQRPKPSYSQAKAPAAVPASRKTFCCQSFGCKTISTPAQQQAEGVVDWAIGRYCDLHVTGIEANNASARPSAGEARPEPEWHTPPEHESMNSLNGQPGQTPWEVYQNMPGGWRN